MSCGNYTSACGICGCNPCCGHGACDPANVIYQSTCADPGSLTVLRHILGLDQNLCVRRLIPSGSGGYFVARQTPNGWAMGFSTTPVVALEEFLAVQGVAFGQVLVLQSDSVMRAMNAPAVANLVLGTNAAGQAMWIPIPASTVPDPLTVGTLTVTGTANFNDVNIVGTTTMTGAATGTLATFLGLNAANEIIKGTLATSTPQAVMFFESPTSPNGATPNKAAVAGSALVIGNEINSSVAAGTLIAVINSQTLQVVEPGYYTIDYSGYVAYASTTVGGNPGILLLVNGVNVNNGNTRPDAAVTKLIRGMAITGFASRRFIAGDTLQLQLASSTGAAPNPETYEVRLRATRLGA